ncbi:hypothetical protein [Limobrevibacterium gyesilva]|nr:hypothetical protein [Limobrevibacterium gyesilva]
MSRPDDDALACAQLQQQIEENATAAAAYAKADAQLENTNIAAGIASGVIGFPALLAMDLSREEQIKLRSLQDRNQRLTFLKDQKRC